MSLSDQSLLLKEFHNEFLGLKKNKKTRVFTIIKTSGKYQSYFSPLRESNNIITNGLVTKKITDLKLIKRSILSCYNYFFIDSKFKSSSGDLKFLNSFFKDKSLFFFFNPTNLTVDSTIQYINLNNFKNLKKIMVIGAGNIGTKIITQLFELGFDVIFSRRNHNLGKNTEKLIKQSFLKNKNSLRYTNNFNSELNVQDCIISCCDNKNIITNRNFKNIKKNTIIIELGKNNFSKFLIEKLVDQNFLIYRVSISNALIHFIENSIHFIKYENQKFGRTKFKNLSIVSGGYLGSDGDIVVDDINNPKKVWGIADGSGNFKKNIKLKSIKKIFS